MPTNVAPTNVLRTFGKERLRISGRFNPNGASDPVIVAIVGGGQPTSASNVTPLCTVTRQAQGQFRIRFIANLGIRGTSGNRSRGAELNNAGATPNRAYAGNLTDNADGTVDMSVFTVDAAGAAQDLGPTTGLTVQFWFEMDELS